MAAQVSMSGCGTWVRAIGVTVASIAVGSLIKVAGFKILAGGVGNWMIGKRAQCAFGSSYSEPQWRVYGPAGWTSRKALDVVVSIAATAILWHPSLASAVSGNAEPITSSWPNDAAQVWPRTQIGGKAGPTVDIRLPARRRFGEYSHGDALRPAQDSLNLGAVGKAYDLFDARDKSQDTPRERRFEYALEAAFQQTLEGPGSAFADRIALYWLPRVNAISTVPPTNDEGWRKVMQQIDFLATSAADGADAKLTPRQLKLGVRFTSALGRKQAELYPAFRRHVAKQLGQVLFRSGIDVSVSGARSEVLRLTSPAFMRNSEIDNMQRGAGSNFLKARFLKVEYRWSRYESDGYHYDMKPPADATVAWWDGPTSQYHTIHLR